MSLRDEQVAFGKDLVKLITRAETLGFEVVIGEVERRIEMQRFYVMTGHSKTLESAHLQKLAADLHFFEIETETWVLSKATLQPLGDYWESLSPKNRWGGNWSGFVDLPHFQRSP